MGNNHPDYRVGSESCFFDPLNPQNFTFYSNPNSNGMLNNYSEKFQMASLLFSISITFYWEGKNGVEQVHPSYIYSGRI